jgi:hypothetical protein
LARKLEITWICGLMAAIGVAMPADAEAGIRVRLYNYASVPQKTIAGAKARASAILQTAGVNVAWAECRLEEHDVPKDAACHLPLSPRDLQVRILDRGRAEKVRASRHCLGYALLANGFDSIAAVFFHRAVDLEGANLATRATILGAMLAHEIGHLLLEQNRHSESGVMRSSWRDEHLKLAAKGRFGFSAEEARSMAATLSRRMGAN